MSGLKNVFGEYFTADIGLHIEKLVSLFFCIEGSQNYMAALSAVHLYLMTFTDQSIVKQVIDYCIESFTSDYFEPHSGKDDEDEKTDWLAVIRDLRTNWRSFKENNFFTHLSRVLGLVVTMKMCEESSLTFSINDYKLIEPDMQVVHGNSMDIADAAFNSVIYFVEKASLCWTYKSLSPLILDGDRSIELDDAYSDIVSKARYAKNGNLESQCKMSEHDFDLKLNNLISDIGAIIPTLSNLQKKFMHDKFLNLMKIKDDFNQSKLASGVRRAPFTLELFGESNQCKTICGDQLIDALLTSAGMSTDKDRQCTLNASDKFMSNYKTHNLVLKLDDLANDKPEFVSTAPTRWVIDIANNSPYYANMADLDAKGRVFVEPKILMATTNVKHLDANVYSRCPFSVQRRMDFVITVKLKKEWTAFDEHGNSLGLDKEKVKQRNADLGGPPLFDDFWLLTVERAIPPKNMEHLATYKPYVYNNVELTDVGIADVLNFLIDRFGDHLENQESIIRSMDARKKAITCCGIDGCRQIEGYCREHQGVLNLKAHPAWVEDADDDSSVSDICHFCDDDSVTSDARFPESENWLEDPRVLSDDDSCTSDPRYPDSQDDFQPHFGKEIVKSLRSSCDMVRSRICSDIFGMDTAVESAAAFFVLRAAKKFVNHWNWVSIIPTPWMGNYYVQQLCLLAGQKQMKKNYIVRTCGMWSFIGAINLYCYRRVYPGMMSPIFSSTVIAGLTVQKNMVNLVKRQYISELGEANSIAPMFKEMRDKHVESICKAGTVVAAVYALSRVYRAWREFNPQGSLEPKTQEEIDKRDAEENEYCEVNIKPLQVQPEAANTSSAQLRGMIQKNLVYGSMDINKERWAVNGLFLRTGVIVIPTHYFTIPNIRVDFYKYDPNQSGAWFECWLSKDTSVRVPGTDLSLCFVTSGGDYADLSKFLPKSDFDFAEFFMYYRRKDGIVEESNGYGKATMTGHRYKSFYGINYDYLSINTRKGLCGATLISKVKPIILGFHLAGTEGTPNGCSGILKIDQYKDALNELLKIEGVVLLAAGTTFMPQSYGVSFMKDEPVHKKSPLNWMPPKSQVRPIGSCIGRSTFKSDAKPTLMTEHVLDVFGFPNIFMPPKEKPPWFGWQQCLSNLARPASEFRPDILQWAIRDYKSDLIPIFTSNLWRDTRPLTELENWNGVPGKRFLDRIKTNTACGFPLVGKKEKLIYEAPPFAAYSKVVLPNGELKNEINRLESCYRNGVRAYPIAKACKKDEIHSKEKCRIFYSNPVAFTFLIRKYFLPLLRVLQFNPKVSECAVGVNSHGPEWDQLHDHIFTFGENRLIGGDYGKYDQKLPSQLLISAMRILIDLAELCDYSEEDILIMHAMVADLVYAVVAFNGDMIMLTSGTHISGNSLTVILNGISGSLNLRCYYREQQLLKNAPEKPFRFNVKLITYGDDNIGSVHPECDYFTIKGASAFLGEHGQVYTMPDKESELKDFLPSSEFEFLKRKSVYHPDMHCRVGALSETSIFKMLHYYLRSKQSPITDEMACAQNIDTANREWFNHGRVVYENRRKQLREVAAKTGVEHLCQSLNLDYDDRINEWLKKYHSTL
jgi:hypothetical protein